MFNWGSLNKGHLIRLAWARLCAKSSLWLFKICIAMLKYWGCFSGKKKPIELCLQFTN